MKISYTNSIDNYKALLKIVQSDTTAFKTSWSIIIGISYPIFVFPIILQLYLTEWMAIIIMSCIIWALYAPVISKNTYFKLERNKFIKLMSKLLQYGGSNLFVEITEENLIIGSALWKEILPLKSIKFQHILEDESTIYIITDSIYFIIIPIADFKDESERLQFLSLINKNNSDEVRSVTL